MPRYLIHLRNDRLIRDETGEDLPDDDRARDAALAVLGEMLRMRSDAFWADGALEVIVEEHGSGRPVARVEARVLS